MPNGPPNWVSVVMSSVSCMFAAPEPGLNVVVFTVLTAAPLIRLTWPAVSKVSVSPPGFETSAPST